MFNELLISVPAWGERYVALALGYVFPAFLEAHRECPEFRPHFVVHTDDPAAFRQWLDDNWSGVRFTTVSIVPDSKYEMLGKAHAEAIEFAAIGAPVVLLNADVVPSRELFSAIADVLDKGQKVLAATGIRTPIDPQATPPIGASATHLLKWGWEHRHPIIEDCVWGRGYTGIPTGIYFDDGENVTAHCFHIHPVMVVKDRQLTFCHTVDNDLMSCYDPDEIHIVSNKEVGFVEMTPRERLFKSGEALSIPSVIRFGRKRFSSRHIDQFGTPISFVGNRWATKWDVVDSIQHGIRFAQAAGKGYIRA